MKCRKPGKILYGSGDGGSESRWEKDGGIGKRYSTLMASTPLKGIQLFKGERGKDPDSSERAKLSPRRVTLPRKRKTGGSFSKGRKSENRKRKGVRDV